MNIDYAQWPTGPERSAGAAGSLIADAIFYEIVRLRVRQPDWDPTTERRFADVAVTARDGSSRFVAGYSTLSGPADGSGPIELWAHAPAVAEISADQESDGVWEVVFSDASVIDDADGLLILDCGFGVAAPTGALSHEGRTLRIRLGDAAEVFIVSGPSAERIRNRYRLAVDQVGLLPSY